FKSQTRILKIGLRCHEDAVVNVESVHGYSELTKCQVCHISAAVIVEAYPYVFQQKRIERHVPASLLLDRIDGSGVAEGGKNVGKVEGGIQPCSMDVGNKTVKGDVVKRNVLVKHSGEIGPDSEVADVDKRVSLLVFDVESLHADVFRKAYAYGIKTDRGAYFIFKGGGSLLTDSRLHSGDLEGYQEKYDQPDHCCD